ncbi:MAG: SDR family oxidoreductase, partial [Dehalococcoidia bacterium]
MNRLRDYYAGKVILLTGGTGLVGTVLMEAVLRRLPEIRSIYVLVRPKVRPGGSTISGEERLWQEVQSSEAFDLLRKQHGDTFSRMFREKVSVVEGDLSLDNMGLDREIYLHLQSEVQIIINCAAMVTFDAPIDEALQLNTLGPRRLLEFARGCRDPVVAHVSTCYVNAVRSGLVPEEPTDPRQTVGQLNGKRQKP